MRNFVTVMMMAVACPWMASAQDHYVDNPFLKKLPAALTKVRKAPEKRLSPLPALKPMEAGNSSVWKPGKQLVK